MTTQRERLIAVIKRIVPDATAFPELSRVLEEAQNRPPEGEADGSLSEREYDVALTIEGALLQLLTAIKEAREVFRR